MKKSKELYLYDSIGDEVKVGDWISYLVPNSRRLNVGPVIGGTDKSIRVLNINFSQLGRHRYELEPTITREFSLCVKIEPPMTKIIGHSHKSMFCAGVAGSASGWSIDDTVTKSSGLLVDLKGSYNYLSKDELDEIFYNSVATGWHWHKEFRTK